MHEEIGILPASRLDHWGLNRFTLTLGFVRLTDFQDRSKGDRTATQSLRREPVLCL